MADSLLKPKQVLREFITALPTVYFSLIIINLPLFIFSPPILGTTLLKIIGILFIFPYLQGASILYTYNYLEKRIDNILNTYKRTLKSFLRLIGGHIIVLLMVSGITVSAFLLFLFIGIPLNFTLKNIIAFLSSLLMGILLNVSLGNPGYLFLTILIVVTGLLLIFYNSKLLTIPHFIVIENRGAEDSFIQTLQLTKNNEIRIFLFLMVGIVLTVSLFYAVALCSEIARIIVVFLCQPLFIVYSVIVYRHLKQNVDSSV